MIKRKNFILLLTVLLFSTSFTYAETGYSLASSGRKVILDPKKITFDLATANNRVLGSESINSLIARTKPIAAINGNFFDAYNTLVPYGSLIKNGQVIYLEGSNASFYTDKMGNPYIDYFSMTLQAQVKNEKGEEDNYFSIWYANSNPNDRTGIYIYTPERGSSVNLKGGSVLTVRGGLIKSIQHKAGSTPIPKDGYLIYFGPEAMDTDQVKARFKKGYQLEIDQVLPDKVKDKLQGSKNIETLISAGPLLVEEGKNVSKKYAGNFEAKISSQAAQRSAIGITRDKKVVLVTQPGMTTHKLANHMIAQGCTSAMNLDGGASSALYSQGKYLTRPGRKLNNMLLAVKKVQPQVREDILLSIDGKKLMIPKDLGSPYIDKNKRTMVPLRFISENLGYKVEWSDKNKEVLIDGKIKIKIGENTAYLDGQPLLLDSPALVLDSRTYLPLRFISEALGHQINYKREAHDPLNIKHLIDISK